MPRHVRKGGGGLNSPQLKKNAYYMHPLLIEILVDVVSITLSLTVHLHLNFANFRIYSIKYS